MSGIFSIAEGARIIFSPGNVRCDNGSFSFAKTQISFCGADNAEWFNPRTDLFQVTNDGQVLTYLGNDETEHFRQWKDSLDDKWFIPAVSHWKYLITERTTSTVSGVKNARFMKCTVRGTACLLLFPDEFTYPDSLEPLPKQRINDKAGNFSKVKYNYAEMKLLEKAGCVILPAIDWEWDDEPIPGRLSHGHDLLNGGALTSGNYWAMPDTDDDKLFHHFIFSNKHYQLGSYRQGLEYSAFIRLVSLR